MAVDRSQSLFYFKLARLYGRTKKGMDAINTSIKDAMGYKSKSAIWSNITLLQTFHHPTRVNIDSIKDIPGSLNKRKHFQSKELIYL